ncbi:hypothetical protein NPIL_121811, partial [Nephila pilipes]
RDGAFSIDSPQDNDLEAGRCHEGEFFFLSSIIYGDKEYFFAGAGDVVVNIDERIVRVTL